MWKQPSGLLNIILCHHWCLKKSIIETSWQQERHETMSPTANIRKCFTVIKTWIILTSFVELGDFRTDIGKLQWIVVFFNIAKQHNARITSCKHLVAEWLLHMPQNCNLPDTTIDREPCFMSTSFLPTYLSNPSSSLKPIKIAQATCQLWCKDIKEKNTNNA